MFVKKCPISLDKANTAILTIFYRSLLEARKTFTDEQRFLIEMSKLVSKLARDYGLVTGLSNLDSSPLTDKEMKQFMDWYYYQAPVFQDKLESESMEEPMRELMTKLYNNTSGFPTYKRLHTEFLKELEDEYNERQKPPESKKGFWKRLFTK